MRISIILIFLLLLSLVLFFYTWPVSKQSRSQNDFAEEYTEREQCLVTVEKRIVRGESLSGLIEPGQTVRILFGYYQCNEVEWNDIVAYQYAGNENPIIKIIKSIPGDEFHLKKTEQGWCILVNGQPLKNSKNQLYVLDEKGHRMLSLYEKDFQGVVPENSYLILGEQIKGSLDSSHFGLIHRSDILGKVVVE